MLKPLAKLALKIRRINNSALPVSMRKDIRNAAIRLDLLGDTRLPNPISIGGYGVNYFHGEQLRYLFDEIFLEGCYLFRSDKDNPLILDCGSNIGMSILFFKKLYPNARIVGFEPDPATFEKLKANVRQNSLQDITLHQCALSSGTGTIDFYHNQERSGDLMMSLHKERLKRGAKIAVPTRALSSFIDEQIDLLKMDIEGAEEAVLPELASSGKLRMVRQIHLEYHHHINGNEDKLSSVLKLLEDAGFGYQLRPKGWIHDAPATFQDIAIFAYNKNAGGTAQAGVAAA